MSDVQRLKEQLHQVSTEAKQAAGGLGGFKLRFGQHSERVEGLIAGTSTGLDRDLTEILDAAARAVDQAAEALEIASVACKDYADQL